MLLLRHFAFQFTRPQGARQCGHTAEVQLYGFNSRAHKGRDFVFSVHSLHVFVSIHAPTRGATYGAFRSSATPVFQFTRPQGARLLVLFKLAVTLAVSIHAPTRGATAKVAKPTQKRTQFQFTRPQGARPMFL